MITGIQQKNEITLFKQYYFVKNLNTKGTIEYNSVSYNQPHTFDDIIHALLYCIDFEQPDGYYFDNKTSTLYIFEHFVFDCSRTNRRGSTLRRNICKVNKEVGLEAKNLSEDKIIIKNIIQGGDVQSGDAAIIHVGQDGEKFRSNYIENFKRQYTNHAMKISDYITHCKQKINVTPNKIITSFLIEDVTLGGTCYKNQNGIREAVNLLLTKQFLEIFSGSPVDYVFFGNLGDDSLTVCDKSIVNDNPSKYMNLLTTDFIVFSAMPQFNYFACIK